MKHNRLGIPKEVKDDKEREPFSTQIWFERTNRYITLTSYLAVTKSSGNKNVIWLSTARNIYGTEHEGTRKKPAVGKRYDHSKGIFYSLFHSLF